MSAGLPARLHHNKVLRLCHDPEAWCNCEHRGFRENTLWKLRLFNISHTTPCSVCVCLLSFCPNLLWAFLSHRAPLPAPQSNVGPRVVRGRGKRNQLDELSRFFFFGFSSQCTLISARWWKAHCASDISEENLSYQLCIKLDRAMLCPTICPASHFTEHFNCLWSDHVRHLLTLPKIGLMIREEKMFAPLQPHYRGVGTRARVSLGWHLIQSPHSTVSVFMLTEQWPKRCLPRLTELERNTWPHRWIQTPEKTLFSFNLGLRASRHTTNRSPRRKLVRPVVLFFVF